MTKLSDVLVRITAQPDASLSGEDLAVIAAFGAVSKVVYERLTPDTCGPSEWPKFCATAEVLRNWAREQEPDIREMYERAIADMQVLASKHVENARRAFAMHEAYGKIAKPPV